MQMSASDKGAGANRAWGATGIADNISPVHKLLLGYIYSAHVAINRGKTAGVYDENVAVTGR